ncbi:MAG: hypothetical protein ACR2FY_03315 [Pirellulaceae bacterium]
MEENASRGHFGTTMSQNGNMRSAVNRLPEVRFAARRELCLQDPNNRFFGHFPEQANMSQQQLKWPLRLLASILAAAMVFNLVVGEEKSAAPTRGGQRLREGTRLLDVSGRFDVVGDRISFVFADSSESVRVLENLSLDRVFRVLSGSQASPQWIISGTVTEYNSGNYLLLTKAVQTAKTPTKETPGASGIGTGPKVDYPVPKEKKPGEKPQEPSHDKHP